MALAMAFRLHDRRSRDCQVLKYADTTRREYRAETLELTERMERTQQHHTRHSQKARSDIETHTHTCHESVAVLVLSLARPTCRVVLHDFHRASDELLNSRSIFPFRQDVMAFLFHPEQA